MLSPREVVVKLPFSILDMHLMSYSQQKLQHVRYSVENGPDTATRRTDRLESRGDPPNVEAGYME